jgi:periplasmic divalent cation tolerance protein
MSGDELVVYVTVPNEDEANRLSEALVNERLAACVNVIPRIRSVYRWEGRVQTDDELLLMIKTTGDRFPELEQRVLQLHSYGTPEVIALRIERGSSDYLGWLHEATRDRPESLD